MSKTSDPFKDFDAHFDRVNKNVDRAQKAAIPLAVVGGFMSLALLGLIGWAIYKLVTHFAG